MSRTNNVLISEQQNVMRELKAVLKSRSMRRLKDLQKQIYDSSLLLLGVHGLRMELGNRKGLEMGLQIIILDRTLIMMMVTIQFQKKESLLLSEAQTVWHLIVLQLTKDYEQDSSTPKTRIKRNSVTSEDHEHLEIVLFMSDPQWRNGYMLLSHALIEIYG